MRVAVVSPYSRKRIEKALKACGFVVSSGPEIVFTYGGDGTILEAEHRFPGVPMVPVQRSRICSNCSVYSLFDLKQVIKAIGKGRYSVAEEQKVEAVFNGRKVSALNEIQLHVKDPRRALRFSLRAPRMKYREIISDGLVAATPYGSTAYYRSIGYAPFKSGIRIGFNNAWPRLPAMEVKKKAVVKLLRESAWLAADNFFKAEMKKSDKITIKPSKKKARFVVMD